MLWHIRMEGRSGGPELGHLSSPPSPKHCAVEGARVRLGERTVPCQALAERKELMLWTLYSNQSARSPYNPASAIHESDAAQCRWCPGREHDHVHRHLAGVRRSNGGGGSCFQIGLAAQSQTPVNLGVAGPMSLLSTVPVMSGQRSHPLFLFVFHCWQNTRRSGPTSVA